MRRVAADNSAPTGLAVVTPHHYAPEGAVFYCPISDAVVKWEKRERSRDAMGDKGNSWDRLLQIRTAGRDASGADEYHHPYEPTDYRVLERLAGSGLIGEGDTVLDYGCGKGRVGFFLSYRTRAKTLGIEYDERIFSGLITEVRVCK